MRRPLLCPLVVITVWTVCDILATQAVGVCDSIQWQIGVEHGASWTQQVGSLPSTVAELTSSLHRAPVAWEQARVTSTWLVLFPTPALRVWVVLPQASPRTELVVAVNVTSDAPELLSVTLASWTHGKLVPQAQWVQHGSTHVVGADVERQAGDPAGSAVPDSEGLNDVVRLVEDCDARHTVASHVDRIVQRHPGWAPASLLSEALKQGTVTVSTDRIARLIEAHPSASLRFRLPSSLHAVVTKPTHTAVETRSHGLRSPATTAAPTVAAGTAHAAVASTVAVVVMHTTPPSAELLAAVAQQSHRPSTTVFVGGRTVLSQDGQAFTAPPALEAALSEGVRCGDTYIAVLAPSVQPDMAWLSTALSVLQGPNNAGIAVMAGKKMTIGDDGVVNGWTSPKTPDERLPSSQARSPGHIHALVDVGLSAWVVSRPVALEFLSQVAVFRSQHPAQFHVPPWHSLDAVGPVALSAVASLAFQLHTVDIGARGGVSTVAHGVLDAQLAEHVEWWRSQRGWRLLQHSNEDAHVGAGFHPTTLESMPRPVVVSSAQTQRLCAPGELPLTRGCLQRGQVTVVLTVFKRGYLEQQLVRVLRQTLVPAAVYVWHNGEHQDIRAAVEAYRSGLLARTHNITPSPDTPPPLRVVHSSFNLRYHGRFTLPLLFGTEFTSIWDDDILPEPRFLSQCVSTSVAHGGALVGAAGRLIRSMDLPFTHVSALGDDSDVPQPLVVDYATLAYTFPTDHIRLLWAEPQLTFTTGEDISFAAALKRHGVRSVVVAQSALEQTRGNTASDDRFLEHASFTVQNSAFVRLGLICRQIVERGFQPAVCREKCRDISTLTACMDMFDEYVSSLVGEP